MILPYAILLGAALIIYPILLFICTRLYPPPKYSIFTRTISGLGDPEHGSAKLFDYAIAGIGIIFSLFPYYLFQVLPQIWVTYVGIVAFYGTPIGLVLVGIFPEHKETGHMIAAFVSFGGALIGNIFLLYPILISDLSTIITILQIILLIPCGPLVFCVVKVLPTYIPDKQIDRLLYNINFWEWMQFIGLQAWITALYINLLIL